MLTFFGVVGLNETGVEFAHPDGKALLLDLHVPDGPGPFPAAILVHGGGFDGGHRDTNVRPLFDVLATPVLRGSASITGSRRRLTFRKRWRM